MGSGRARSRWHRAKKIVAPLLSSEPRQPIQKKQMRATHALNRLGALDAPTSRSIHEHASVSHNQGCWLILRSRQAKTTKKLPFTPLSRTTTNQAAQADSLHGLAGGRLAARGVRLQRIHVLRVGARELHLRTNELGALADDGPRVPHGAGAVSLVVL